MNRMQLYQVFPNIPDDLIFLETLSRNLWWSWDQEANELFRRIGPKKWEDSGPNPIRFLTTISQKRFEELSQDDGYMGHLNRVKKRFRQEVCDLADPEPPFEKSDVIAYFSMEFGIHQSLPLFAGGLGILAGDHLKAASNRKLPLVGLGILYRHGYFRQFMDQSGWQQEEYPETDIFYLPMVRVKDAFGKDIHVNVNGPIGKMKASIWILKIGCIPLYLLDTNLAENSQEIRDITGRLYAGDPKVRLSQEALLGIGGMRLLEKLGLRAKVCHMNEGHSAFAGLERVAQAMSLNNITLKAALEIVPRSTIFTTHTPVPAGHDEFPVDMVKPVIRDLVERLNTTEAEILSWGQGTGAGPDAPVSMFILALQMAEHRNGVSKLHGKVARKMWAHVWPDLAEDETPIEHITNGVHIPTWISQENAQLFERYIGPQWNSCSLDPTNSRRVNDIYEEELWRAHEMSRLRLIRYCRKIMIQQYGKRNAPRSMMEAAGSVFDQDVLTIAFARRFATYKRANLLLQDPDRFEAILTSEKTPVQFIFAGKAHPRDNEGKELIKRLIQFARKISIRHRIVFLEDYDMNLAQHLVQGADVWLNTPRRPYEACGTSGMKAAINGVLNVSILDGWWDEEYNAENGWRIGNGEEYQDCGYQDSVESQALYNVLENDVIPCFYDRKNGEYPQAWLKMMKASMAMAMKRCCSLRMLGEYEQRYYMPSAQRFDTLLKNNAEEAMRLSALHKRLHTHWKGITISRPVRELDGPFRVGEWFRVTAEVSLGELVPDEVDIEVYYGHIKSLDVLHAGNTVTMDVEKKIGDGKYLYSTAINCKNAGRYGITVRVMPRGDKWIKFTPGLITWPITGQD
ncbi:MAG: alpha-glucan family phosphorylase [Desulfobacterales bacterium]|nr:alpha-glucan family phosphorylase [Desulfobacterales bacterium]